MMTAPVETKPPRRRRGLRVSLRVFMLVVLVVACLLGWKANKARGIRRSIAEVHRLGGMAWYDYQLIAPGNRDAAPRPEPRWMQRLLGPEYFHDVHAVLIHYPYLGNDAPPRIRDVSFLSNLSELRWFELSNSGVDDAAFGRMVPLPRLMHLSLHEPRLGDAGLGWISGSRDLRTLTIACGPCGDETARRVGQLSKVTQLELHAPRMTDDGMEALSSLKALRTLALDGYGLGDRSLIVVGGFAALEELSLGRLTRATNGGLGRLASLTKLRILKLRGPSLSRWDMASLSELAFLYILDLSDSNFGRLSFSSYSAPPALQMVWVHEASIWIGSLDALAKAPGLTHFAIYNSEISDETIRRLRKAYPRLFVLKRTNGRLRRTFTAVDLMELL